MKLTSKIKSILRFSLSIFVVLLYAYPASAAVSITSGNTEITDSGSTAITIMDARDPNDGFADSTVYVRVPFTDAGCSTTVDDYFITLKVRAQDENEYTLVDFKKNGEAGDYDAIYNLEVTGDCIGGFEASYQWNPSNTQALGYYDLYAYVFDGTGTGGGSIDDYVNNEDEVELSSDGVPGFPLDVPNTFTDPVGLSLVQVDINTGGAEPGDTTIITTAFFDADGHDSSTFNVKIVVRHPDNDIETTIVNGTNGAVAARGADVGLLTVGGSLGSYTVSFTWTPERGAPSAYYDYGPYDISVIVTDEDGLAGEIAYSTNLDVLDLVSNNTAWTSNPPAISSVSALPTSITPGDTTTLSASFSDADTPAIGTLTGSFYVRAEDNSVEYGPYDAIIANVGGSNYEGTYVWDSTGKPNGWYDLYFKVEEDAGNNGEGDVSGFDSNIEAFRVEPTIDLFNVEVYDVPLAMWMDFVYLDRQPDNDGLDFYETYTNIKACFIDGDGGATIDYLVTIKVRNPDNSTTETLVSSVQSGVGGMTIDSGDGTNGCEVGQERITLVSWEPLAGNPEGLYDIYVSVYDSVSSSTGVSDFPENADMVSLNDDMSLPPVPYDFNEAPSVGTVTGGSACVGGGACLPSTDSVIMTLDFYDPDLSATTDVTIDVSIRHPDGSTEYVLVTGGDTTTTACSYDDAVCAITVTSLGSDMYQVGFEWNPDETGGAEFDPATYPANMGWYDIKIVVIDDLGAGGESGYDDNPSTLSIGENSFPSPPTDAPVITAVWPAGLSVLQLESADLTTLTATFTDADNPSDFSFYTGSFSVRAPDDTEIAVSCDASGLFDIIYDATFDHFEATCNWKPVGTLDIGYYDLLFNVKDHNWDEASDPDNTDDVTETSTFDDNLDEVELTLATNLAPNVPSSLTQYKADGTTPITTYTAESTVIFKASMTDQNAVDDIALEIEVELSGTAFDGDDGSGSSDDFNILCFPDFPHSYSGTAVTGEVSCDFTAEGEYHWQATTVDTEPLSSAWVLYPDADPDFVVDWTAPTVVMTDPTDTGSSDTTQNLTITFTDAVAGIDCTTVTTASFYIAPALAGSPSIVSCDDVTGIVVLDPSTTVAMGDSQAYTLTVTTAVTDKAGNALASEFTGAFTAAESNLAPNDPIAANIGQYSDAIATISIAAAAWINNANGLYIKGTSLSDQNSTSDDITLEVEIKEQATAFDGTVSCSNVGTESGATTITIIVDCTGVALATDQGYKWRVRLIDVGLFPNPGGWIEPVMGYPHFQHDDASPTFGTVTASNVATATHVDGSFDLSTTFADGSGSTVTGCEYAVDGAWNPATWGAGTCTHTGITGLTDAQAYDFNMRATDAAGNVGTATLINKTIDKTVPIDVPALADGSGTDIDYSNAEGSQSANWTVSSDGGSGLQGYYACIDTNAAAPAKGDGCYEPLNVPNSITVAGTYNAGSTYYWHVYAIDNVENTSTNITDSDGVLIDATKPVTASAVAGTDDTHVTLVFTEVDSFMDIATTDIAGNYTIYEGAACSGTVLPVTGALLQGDNKTVILETAAQSGFQPYIICVNTTNVKDIAGNTVDTVFANYTESFVGYAAGIGKPETTITDPASDALTITTSPYTIQGGATDDDDMDLVEVQIDALGWNTATASCGACGGASDTNITWTWDWTLPSEDYVLHTIYARAHDTYGGGQYDDTPAARTVYVDNVAPTVFTLSSPADNDDIKDTTPILTWNASTDRGDSNQIDKYMLYVDGGLDTDFIPFGTFSVETASTYSEAAHTWYVIAVDKAGNTRQSATWNFTIDATPPAAFTLSTPADNDYVSSGTPPLAWNNSSDAGSGLDRYILYVDTVSDTDPATSPQITGTSYSDGPHTWYVQAVDNAGNTRNSTNTWTFIVETAGPYVTLAEAPTDGTHVEVTLVDDASGIDSATTQNASDYTIWDGGACSSGGQLTVTDAVWQGSGVVELTTATQIGAQSYTVCVSSNIKDIAGNSMSGSNSADFIGYDSVDVTAPEAVTDMRVRSPGQYARGLTLEWTEPDDNDGFPTSGGVSEYFFQYTDAIDYPATLISSFPWDGTDTKKAAKEPTPYGYSAGDTATSYGEFFNLKCAEGVDNATCSTDEGKDLLYPNTLYFVAMKSDDEVAQTSAISNVQDPRVTGVEATHTALKRGWNFISLPYDFDGDGDSLDGLFNDDFGGVSPYDSYRISATGSLTAVTSSTALSGSNINNGEGFYFYSPSNTIAIDEKTSGGGSLLSDHTDNWVGVEITNAVGWQMLIGNPWTRNLEFERASYADVYICQNGTVNASANLTQGTNPCSGGTGVLYGDAAANGWVTSSVSFFANSTTYTAELCPAAGSCPVTLRPWWGHWVGVEGAESYAPNADAGGSSGFTVNTTNISDASDATYMSTTAGTGAVFNVDMENIASSGRTVSSVDVYVRAAVINGESGERIEFGINGSIDGDDTNDAYLSVSYKTFMKSFTPGSYDAMTIRVQVTDAESTDDEVRISEVWAVVNFDTDTYWIALPQP